MSALTSGEPVAAAQPVAAEHAAWTRHRDFLLRVPATDRWRGCHGISLIVTRPAGGVCHLGRLFVPDSDLRWVSLVDLPPGTFQLANAKDVQWARSYRTSVRYGMPTLGGAAEVACDFRRPPCHHRPAGVWAGRRNLDAFDPTRDPHLFRVFNALNLAMTGSAVVHQAAWRPHREGFVRIAEEPGGWPGVEESLGGDRGGSASRPAAWMPRPYLAFKAAHRAHVYAWATPGGATGGRPFYSPALKRRLCEDLGHGMPVHSPVTGTFHGASRSSYHGYPVVDLTFDSASGRLIVRATRRARVYASPGASVHEGDLVASDGPDRLPDRCLRLGAAGRWHFALRSAADGPIDRWLRLWFDRQLLDLRPGLVHAPAELAAAAAAGRSVEAELYWDLGPAMAHYREEADAFVFPPFRLRTWRQFRGVLPGEVAYDLTPLEPRYRRRPAYDRHRSAACLAAG